MAFRYINPGYVSLLDNDVTATEVTGTTYSRTGTGFSQTNSAAGITIPHFASGDDFWAKFDAYIPSGSSSNIYCYMPNSYKVGFEINVYDSGENSIYIICHYSNNNRQIMINGTAEYLGMRRGAINEFLIHIVPGTSATARLDLWINGNNFSQSGLQMLYSDSYSKIAILYSSNQNVIFSNVIFSDEEIFQRERIIALPILSTETNMTFDASELYIANAANQTLLQTPDVASLITDYGANSTITGVAVVGNPAYKTGTGITTLTGLSKSGGVISEHNSCNLSEETLSTAMSGWTLYSIRMESR